MAGISSKAAYSILVISFVFLCVTVVEEVKGRQHLYRRSNNLVSDGVDDDYNDGKQNSFLVLKGIEYKYRSYEECKQMYGFLPCSNNILGHLFLVLVYEYLLFHAESYLADGSEQIFKILGPGIFGASAFQILGALPEASILLASGLLYSKEEAEEYVFTGVGLFAGSSILLLTIVWGTCIATGSLSFSNVSNSRITTNASQSKLISWTRVKTLLTGCGIETDLQTSYTARIMAFSAIPFIITQIPNIFHFSTGARAVTMMIALVISFVFLLLYFVYQFFEPWIQRRTLEYVKHEHLIVKILQHVEKHTLERILTSKGSPNINSINRLFEKMDKNKDNVISASELKRLLYKTKLAGTDAIEAEKEIAHLIEILDLDGDRMINKDEFIIGFTKWLDETKHAMKKQYFSRKSLKELYKALGPWIEIRKQENEMKNRVVSEILRHAQTNLVGSLLKDGTPDKVAIKRLFEKIDRNGDNLLSKSELKELIKDIKFGKFSVDVEEAVVKVIEGLDLDGDNVITEEEFVLGVEKWLNPSDNASPLLTPQESESDILEETWEEADIMVSEEQGKELVDKSLWAWFKAILLMVFGIGVLLILAEPLIDSVHNFSEEAGIPSFFISFILVPLATSARTATSAIKSASRKKPKTTSLIFSEIYGAVFMNNILGFSVLLILIYVRGMEWQFSAELLVVAIVTAMMGLVASFRITFPLWTSFCAYLLYPLSLLLVFLFNDVLNYV